jgi:hypothetical protein
MSPLPRTDMVPRPGDGNGRTGCAGPAVPRTQQRDRAGTGRANGRGTGTAAHAGTGTVADAVGLMPASRAALDRLLERGDPLTRDSFAAQLRHDGHPVRNARVSSLLTVLRSETQESLNAHPVPSVHPRRHADQTADRQSRSTTDQ